MVNGEFMLQCLNLNNEAEQLTNLLGVLGTVSLDVLLPSDYCLLFVTNCKLPIAHSPFTIHHSPLNPFTIHDRYSRINSSSAPRRNST